MPGNSIELPSGVTTQPRAVFLGTLEPQVLQKALPKVLGDCHKIFTSIILTGVPDKLLRLNKKVSRKGSTCYLTAA